MFGNELGVELSNKPVEISAGKVIGEIIGTYNISINNNRGKNDK